jgi:LPS-assembly lipoprotein
MVLLLVSLLAGCGYRLAGKADLDPVFENSHVTFAAGGQLIAQLVEEQLQANDVNIVELDEASAIINILYERRTREILSLDEQGRVSEYELIMQIGLNVVDAEGKVLINNQDFRLSRDFFFEIQEVLGNEERVIYDELRQDISRLIIYRLQAVSTPETTES